MTDTSKPTTKKIGGKTLSATLAAAVLAIVASVVSVEGGYVNNKNDPGGATNHGVTEKVARANGYQGHMRDLPKETAVEIYAADYVTKANFEGIVDLSAAVGEEVIDTGVNAGTGRSARWFQRSINQLNSPGGCPIISVDGQVGPATLDAYSCLMRTRGARRACQMTIKLMDAQQAQHYMALVDRDPKFSTFIVGWVDHRVGNVSLNRC